MAEGDTFTDEDTGEQFVEGPGGALVRAAGQVGSAVSKFMTGFAGGVGSAAKDTQLIGAGVQQILSYGARGLAADPFAEGLQRNADQARANRQAMTSPFEIAAEQTSPVGFFAGQMGGSMLPGTPALQGLFGALQGLGMGETPAEQFTLGALGSLGGFGGGRGGRRAAQESSQAFQARNIMGGTASARSRVQAARLLAREGVPMTESDLASEGIFGAGPRRRDLVRDTLDPGAQDLAKRRALTEVTTDAILPGQRQDVIDDGWLSKADEAIDKNYSALRRQVGPLSPTDRWVDDSQTRMLEIVEKLPNSVAGDPQFFVDEIIQDVASGKTSGEWWSSLRSRINRRARNSQDADVSRALYQIREELDRMVSGGDPEFVVDLGKANELFRLVEPLHRRGVVQEATGTINPSSYTRVMRDMFPGIYRETFGGSDTGKRLFDIFRAASRFPAFRSSFTAERLTATNVARRAAAGAQLAVGSIPEIAGGAVGRRTALEAGQLQEEEEE